MPKIRWTDLPPSLRQHLFDRVADRQIPAADLYKLKLWRESEPEAPAGAWYKDFGSFKICGEGESPKTFLLKGQPAKGKALEKRAVGGAAVPRMQRSLFPSTLDSVSNASAARGRWRDVPDDEFPDFTPLRASRGADRPLGRREGLARLGEKCPPRRGQLHPSVRPAKQTRSDLVLEPADLLAQWWLRDVQARCRAAEMQLLGDGEKGPEVSQLHPPNDISRRMSRIRLDIGRARAVRV